MTKIYDACIVGGGLVGLAVGRALLGSHPGASLLVLEKEDRVGFHQSGHNSGVIHSGLYYRPGSLKARLAVEGAREMYQLCAHAGIPHRRSGKVVVATSGSEIAALDELERRGRANGLDSLRRLAPDEISELEPAAVGVDALSVPSAGVVDFPVVANYLAAELEESGAEVLLGHPLTRLHYSRGHFDVVAGEAGFRSRFLINCAGLYSDKVALLAGIEPAVRIVPFRGEYFTLAGADAIKALIYPVPDPRFPFLGVHFTRRIDNSVEVGPNALLALGREHYRGVAPDWSETMETLRYRGFRRLAARHLLPGIRELVQSTSKHLYARLARRLVPGVRPEQLLPGGVGVRAQAVDRDGHLVDDFVIETTDRSIHVLNAPSPGATASLAIGRYVADLAGQFFQG